MPRYYVSGYTETQNQDDHFRPICVTKIGVAMDRHIYNDSENLDTPSGRFYVNVYSDLAAAWESCKDHISLSTLVIDDNMSDADKQYISDYINMHPEMMNYRYSGSGNSYYNKRMSYIHHHEMKSMCEANGLRVDFSKADSTALSEKYSQRCEKNGVDSNIRESIFDKQADYQKSMGIRFSMNIINDVTDVSISDEEAEQRMDSYYKDIADIYGTDYVSISDIELGDIQEAADGSEFSEVIYNGEVYIVTFDAKRRESRRRQAANDVLRQIREASIAQFAAEDREMADQEMSDDVAIVAEESGFVSHAAGFTPSDPHTDVGSPAAREVIDVSDPDVSDDGLEL